MTRAEPRIFGAAVRRLVEVGKGAHGRAAFAVAVDEAVAECVGRGESPATLRIWEGSRAIVVPRSRLRRGPVRRLVDQYGHAWPICGRASGGAVVAHGPGTLNLSVILPVGGGCHLSIAKGYRLWIAILDAALRGTYDVAVDVGLVEGAFCAGRYDGVADGRKVAGIAQARRGRSVIVHGTILVHVDRGAYLRLIAAAEQRLGIPNAWGEYESTAIVSLHELVGSRVSTHELARAIGRVGALGYDQATNGRQGLSLLERTRAQEISAQW